MATRIVVKTAREYARSLVPHLEHESYRADRPFERVMGKGCRVCDVEVLVSLRDFVASGDLPAYEEEIKPHLPKEKKGKK
jgi:hypothetical protein